VQFLPPFRPEKKIEKYRPGPRGPGGAGNRVAARYPGPAFRGPGGSSTGGGAPGVRSPATSTSKPCAAPPRHHSVSASLLKCQASRFADVASHCFRHPTPLPRAGPGQKPCVVKFCTPPVSRRLPALSPANPFSRRVSRRRVFCLPFSFFVFASGSVGRPRTAPLRRYRLSAGRNPILPNVVMIATQLTI